MATRRRRSIRIVRRARKDDVLRPQHVGKPLLRISASDPLLELEERGLRSSSLENAFRRLAVGERLKPVEVFIQRGRLHVHDGRHRLLAARELGEQVEVVVIETDRSVPIASRTRKAQAFSARVAAGLAARTAQAEWLDAMIRHQIGLLRVAGGIRRKVFELLDATEADMRARIRDRLRHYRGTGLTSDVRRLAKLQADIVAIRSTAWREVNSVWRQELTAVALAEPQFMAALLETVVPVQLETTLPTARQLRSIVTSRPFEGQVLARWADGVRRADIERIHQQINIGLTQSETIPEISRRVVGTVSMRGRDGATEVTRRNAEAITRTATNHVANQSRREFFAENADIVSRELFVATLDSRTTPVCRANDGRIFALGEGPIPPLHFACRSVRTALLDAEAIGERPAKPVTERRLLREWGAQRKLDRVPRSREDLPRGTRGAFDRFARQRTRELTGRLPAKTTYQEFLARQSAAVQDDILGVTRGRLFRRGGLTLQQFIDRAGKEIPLRDLARMHERAFRAAGLEPADFLRGRR